MRRALSAAREPLGAASFSREAASGVDVAPRGRQHERAQNLPTATRALPRVILVGLTAKVTAGRPSAGVTVTPSVTGMKKAASRGTSLRLRKITWGKPEISFFAFEGQSLPPQSSLSELVGLV